MKRFGRLLFVVVFAVLTLCIVKPGIAQDESQQTNYPRSFALGFTSLKEHSFGGLLRARFNKIAVDISMGSLPVIFMVERRYKYGYSDSEIETYFGMSFHIDGSLVFFFQDNQRRFQSGLRVGGIWDSIMGEGFMLGWIGDLGWERLTLGFGGGVQLYPNFLDNAKEYFGIEEELESSSSSGPFGGPTQIYIGVNISWYLS